MAQAEICRAVAAINAARFDEARQILQQQLVQAPGNLEALYLLGVTEQSSHQHDLALSTYDRILAMNPHHLGAHYSKAMLLSSLGRHSDALGHHDAAIRLSPGNIWTWINRGNAHAALKNYADAISDYDHALGIQPDQPDALTNKGNVLLELGKLVQALQCFERSIQLRPDSVVSWLGKGRTLIAMLRFEEGLSCAAQTLQLAPDNADAWCIQGLCLAGTRKFEEAIASYRQAIDLNPAHHESWCGLGSSLQELDQYQEALDCLGRAIEIDPQYADAYINLGATHIFMGHKNEARASLEKAIALQPEDASAQWNLATLLLGLGDYSHGWEYFESRWRAKELNFKKVTTQRPHWTGQPSDRPLLLWGEQGIGDQILYGSILPELTNLPQKKFVALDKRLVPLFARSMPGFEFIDLTQAGDTLEFAEQLPLGSLPRLFRPSGESFAAARHPFLFADPQRVAALRVQIGRPGQRVCGVSWSSNRKSIGRHKSINLEQLLAPLHSDSLHFVNLQYGDTSAELQALQDSQGIAVQHVAEVDNFNDIDGLAALIDACDIVITTSNSTAHIAGALGKETLLLLPIGKGRLWYWSESAGHNPWYPSIQAFSQEQGGDWSQPIAAIKTLLAHET